MVKPTQKDEVNVNYKEEKALLGEDGKGKSEELDDIEYENEEGASAVGDNTKRKWKWIVELDSDEDQASLPIPKWKPYKPTLCKELSPWLQQAMDLLENFNVRIPSDRKRAFPPRAQCKTLVAVTNEVLEGHIPMVIPLEHLSRGPSGGPVERSE